MQNTTWQRHTKIFKTSNALVRVNKMQCLCMMPYDNQELKLNQDIPVSAKENEKATSINACLGNRVCKNSKWLKKMPITQKYNCKHNAI